MDSIQQVKPIEQPQQGSTNMWDDPEFQKGLLEDIRTEIADRVYEGRDQTDVMKGLYAKRAELVQKLKAAGHEVPHS